MSVVVASSNSGITIVLAIVIIASILLPFFIFARVLWRYKSISGKKRTLEQETKHKVLQEQMNTDVTLTDEEKRSMKQNMVIGAVVLVFVFGSIIGVTAWRYWRFAVSGTETQATIVSIATRTVRNSGKHSSGSHTEYTYSLSAVVDGKTVVDTYNAGRDGIHKKGDVIDVFAATSDTHTDLAFVSDIQSLPFTTGFPLTIVGGIIGYSLYIKSKRIQSGKMKLGNLPVKFRKAHLADIQLSARTGIEPANPMDASVTQRETTPDGLPVYTIGGGDTSKASDGSDYRA